MCRHVFLNPITHYRNFSHFISCYYFYIFLVKRPLKAKRRLTILLTLSHTHIWYMAQWPKIGGKITRLFASIGLQSRYVKKDFKNDFSFWWILQSIIHAIFIELYFSYFLAQCVMVVLPRSRLLYNWISSCCPKDWIKWNLSIFVTG